MKKYFSIFAMLLLCSSFAVAQKKLYIPDEWKNPWNPDTLLYAEEDPDNRYTWSRSRSVESDNVIVLWDKGYGSTLPSKSPEAYRVDEQDLLKKCEAFYDLEINKLGFVDPETTNLRKYKVMVLLSHTTDWVCYGGGYDFEVSALWIGPSACKPVGHSVAHEVGHSFHYMCYADASGNRHTSSTSNGTGFHLPVGNGQTIWEQTAQWQANQSYPSLMFDQSIGVFRNSHNLAFTHEWHRYQSYWLHYYLCQKYDDITTIGQIWRQPLAGAKDFNQALMANKGLDVVGLYKLYYDYAAHCATWDFDVCTPFRNPYIGDFSYRCCLLDSHKYQVALASTPQSTGFNIIPLKVPSSGSEITIHFTALPSGSSLCESDPKELFNGESRFEKQNRTAYIRPTNSAQRAFRLGFVALKKDGERVYINEDSLYCQTNSEVTCDVKMTVDEGTEKLWFIVVPAPKTYVQHKWTENIGNAEHWPYRMEIVGTDLDDKATVYALPTLDGREISDVTVTYDVYTPVLSNYATISVSLSGQAYATLGTALQTDPATISSKLQTYSASGPQEGRMMFYPLNPITKALVNRGSTANGYGHWFSKTGTVTDYGNGYVFSELDAQSLTFNIGQYPGKMKVGDNITIGQAFRYKQSLTKEAIARFVFNIHISTNRNEVVLNNVEYDDPTSGIGSVTSPATTKPSGTYTLGGQKVPSPTNHGIYIIDGRKEIK